MKVTKNRFLRHVLFLGLLCFSINLYSQGGPPGVGTQTLTVVSAGTLNFGTFSRLNGGTITMDPNGTVSKTGDIFLLNSPRSVVSFNISTNLGTSRIVTVTAPPSVLTGPGSLELSMIFDRNSFTIDKNNPAIIQMGGTLTVGPEDLPGNYTGSVSVTFAYQ